MAESGKGQPKVSSARQTMEILMEMSRILNTGLDMETLATCVRLCETGVNPEALALVFQELRKESATIRKSEKRTTSKSHTKKSENSSTER